MGTSTNAYLMYGYDLGGGDSDWLIEGLGEDEAFERPWYDEEEGIRESVELALLASVGFTETDWQAEGFFERKKAAEAKVGVEVESHCSGDYPMYVLAAKKFTAYRGDCEEVDFAVDPAWDERLAHALKVLDIKPTQERPAWLLASYWG